MTIVEFLTARLDQAERRYRRGIYSTPHWETLRTSGHLGGWVYSRQHGISVEVNDAVVDAAFTRMRGTLENWDRDHTKQWLAEVAAMRAIVAQHEGVHECPSPRAWSLDSNTDHVTEEECWTLRNLASVYADHADYEQAWAIAT